LINASLAPTQERTPREVPKQQEMTARYNSSGNGQLSNIFYPKSAGLGEALLKDD
jgi:hypothetical protein